MKFILLPSYSVKPKSIDFTGFDDIYLPLLKHPLSSLYKGYFPPDQL